MQLRVYPVGIVARGQTRRRAFFFGLGKKALRSRDELRVVQWTRARMKYFFLVLWLGFTGVTVPLAALAVCRSPAPPGRLPDAAGLRLYLAVHPASDPGGYRPACARGASRLGFWLGLLLPLTLLPLHSAYETWQRGYYLASLDGRRTRLVGLVLEMLQQWVGYWGPIFVLVVFSLSMAVLLWRVLITSRR